MIEEGDQGVAVEEEENEFGLTEVSEDESLCE